MPTLHTFAYLMIGTHGRLTPYIYFDPDGGAFPIPPVVEHVMRGPVSAVPLADDLVGYVRRPGRPRAALNIIGSLVLFNLGTDERVHHGRILVASTGTRGYEAGLSPQDAHRVRTAHHAAIAIARIYQQAANPRVRFTAT